MTSRAHPGLANPHKTVRHHSVHCATSLYRLHVRWGYPRLLRAVRDASRRRHTRHRGTSHGVDGHPWLTTRGRIEWICAVFDFETVFDIPARIRASAGPDRAITVRQQPNLGFERDVGGTSAKRGARVAFATGQALECPKEAADFGE